MVVSDVSSSKVYILEKDVKISSICSRVIELSEKCTKSVEIYLHDGVYLSKDQAETVRKTIQSKGYENVSLSYNDQMATYRLKSSAKKAETSLQ